MKNLIKIIIIILFINCIPTYSVDFITVPKAKKEKESGSYDSRYDDFYRLTPHGYVEKGAIWSDETVDLDEPFLIEIIANFGELDEEGADGIAFVFHKDPSATSAIGGNGHGIGYGKVYGADLKKSIAFEFDTFHNGTHNGYPYSNDISADHFDIRRNGIMNGDNGFTKKELTDKCGNTINVENDLNSTIHIYWMPGIPVSNPVDKSVGTLVVYFNCYEIYRNASFDIDDGNILKPEDDTSDPIFGFQNRKGSILTNPSDENYSRIILFKGLTKYKISLYDVAGNFVSIVDESNLNVLNYNFEFNISFLPIGSYFIRLEYGECVINKQFVKE